MNICYYLECNLLFHNAAVVFTLPSDHSVQRIPFNIDMPSPSNCQTDLSQHSLLTCDLVLQTPWRNTNFRLFYISVVFQDF